MGSIDYEVSWLAKLLHSFPHIDLTFRHINSTFDPDNTRYNESLLFWAAIPVLWLLLTLLLFLIYFCYRCCQRDVEKKQKVPCLRWSMAILALLTCAAVGVGFYGNEEAHKGSQQLSSASDEADLTITNIKELVSQLGDDVNNSIVGGITGLQRSFRKHPHLEDRDKERLHQHTEAATVYAKSILTSVLSVQHKITRVNTNPLVRYAREYGFYRWLGTLLLLCWWILLCLLLLLGIGLSSKCTLLMFCAFGIFSLVLCWMSAGFHLAGSVGLGDFCVSPEGYFEKLQTEAREKNVVKYYIQCDTLIAPSPFENPLNKATENVEQANTTLNLALRLAAKSVGTDHNREVDGYVGQVYRGLGNSSTSIRRLTTLVTCNVLHKDYVDGVQAVCNMALPGAVFLFLSSSVTGLLLTLLVLLASRAWRHFGKKEKDNWPSSDTCTGDDPDPLYPGVDDASVTHYRAKYSEVSRQEPGSLPSPGYEYHRKGYLEIDEDDPFLPRPDNSSPSYYSFTRGNRGNQREHMSLPRRSTPPPAYNSNEFYRQYSDMNSSTMDDSNPFRESHA